MHRCTLTRVGWQLGLPRPRGDQLLVQDHGEKEVGRLPTQPCRGGGPPPAIHLGKLIPHRHCLYIIYGMYITIPYTVFTLYLCIFYGQYGIIYVYTVHGIPYVYDIFMLFMHRISTPSHHQQPSAKPRKTVKHLTGVQQQPRSNLAYNPLYGYYRTTVHDHIATAKATTWPLTHSTARHNNNISIYYRIYDISHTHCGHR